MVTPSGLCLKESMYPIDLILKWQHGYVALRQFRVFEQCSPFLQTGGREWMGGGGAGCASLDQVAV